MIKIDDHTDVDLDALAEQHYNSLIGTPLVNGISYHATVSLIGRIRIQKAKDEQIANQIRVDFWNYLLDNNFTNLKRVITSRPDILKNIITEIENICGKGFFSNDVNYNKAKLTPFGKIVGDIFNYDGYRKTKECRDNCNEFNLAYCPYCNVQVIQVITETTGLSGQAKRTALLQLDHFYPKSRHPYFSISFFNMIPGCSNCNAVLKLDKKFDIDSHFNPFHKRFDDYFKFELDSFFLNQESDVNFKIVFKKAYPINSIRDFKILQRYNNDSHCIGSA